MVKAVLQSPEDWDAWEKEIETLAASISPEDHLRVEAALAEADREAKAFVRRQNRRLDRQDRAGTLG